VRTCTNLPGLIDELLHRIGRRHGRSLRLAGTASRALLAYAWPGNVRELENALEYAVTVCTGQTIHVGDLPADVRLAEESSPAAQDRAAAPRTPAAESPRAPRPEDPEANRIRDVLVRVRYHRGDAARMLGMSRTTLWRKMRELGL